MPRISGKATVNMENIELSFAINSKGARVSVESLSDQELADKINSGELTVDIIILLANSAIHEVDDSVYWPLCH